MSEEKYGFRIGQKVRLVSGGGEYPLYGFRNGGEYTVQAFGGNSGVKECINIGTETNPGFANSSQIQPITETTTVTGPATITVAAGETITFDGNATVKQDWIPKFGDHVVFVDQPSGMVGDFGVVLEEDSSDGTYRVAYNIALGTSYAVWCSLSKIKPYEAA